MTLAIQTAETEIALDVKSVVKSAFDQCATKADVAELRGELLARISETKSEMIRWMFLFWIGQVAVTVGLLRLTK